MKTNTEQLTDQRRYELEQVLGRLYAEQGRTGSALRRRDISDRIQEVDAELHPYRVKDAYQQGVAEVIRRQKAETQAMNQAANRRLAALQEIERLRKQVAEHDRTLSQCHSRLDRLDDVLGELDRCLESGKVADHARLFYQGGE